jgi:hypothetical protein
MVAGRLRDGKRSHKPSSHVFSPTLRHRTREIARHVVYSWIHSAAIFNTQDRNRGDVVGREPATLHRDGWWTCLYCARSGATRLPAPSPSPRKNPPPARQVLEQLPEARKMSPAQKGIIAKRGSAQPPEMEAQKNRLDYLSRGRRSTPNWSRNSVFRDETKTLAHSWAGRHPDDDASPKMGRHVRSLAKPNRGNHHPTAPKSRRQARSPAAEPEGTHTCSGR